MDVVIQPLTCVIDVVCYFSKLIKVVFMFIIIRLYIHISEFVLLYNSFLSIHKNIKSTFVK